MIINFVVLFFNFSSNITSLSYYIDLIFVLNIDSKKNERKKERREEVQNIIKSIILFYYFFFEDNKKKKKIKAILKQITPIAK